MSADSETRCLALVGFTISREVLDGLLEVEPYPPVQTCRFAWAMLDALAAGLQPWQVDGLSSLPISPYPHNPRVLVGLKRLTSPLCRSLRILPFVNLPVLRSTTRLASMTCALAAWCCATWRDDRRAILLHGTTSSHVCAAWVIAVILRVPLIVILTDPPSMPLVRDSRINGRCRSLDRMIQRAMLRCADGVVALAPRLAVDFAPGKPTLILDGILSNELAAMPQQIRKRREVGSPFVVMYAGGLLEEYGVAALLDAFSLLPREKFRLVIAGGGPLRDAIRDRASRDTQIEYQGLLGQQALWTSMCSADLLINPRPSGTALSEYSFPSKTLEYLATGTPLLSTKFEAMSNEYTDVMLTLEYHDAAGIALALQQAAAASPERLRELGVAGRQFVLSTRAPGSQGTRLCEFLDSLTS